MIANPTQTKRLSPFGISTLLLASAVCVAGCTPSRFSAPFLTAVPRSASSAPGTVSVTAICPPGATRIGGGYYVAPDGRNKGIVVRGSYPSDQNGWTLEVDNTSPVMNEDSNYLAVAYCAQRADLSLSAAVNVIGSPAPLGNGALTSKTMINAPCSAPAVLTGGGFYLDGPLDSSDAAFNGGIQESAPDGTVWHVEFGEGLHTPSTRLVRAYAVCTTGLPGGAMVEVSKVPMPTPAEPITIVEAICDPSAYTTAGGFRLNGEGQGNPSGSLAINVGRAFQSVATGEFQRWNVQADSTAPSSGGGLAPVTAVALCATIP